MKSLQNSRLVFSCNQKFPQFLHSTNDYLRNSKDTPQQLLLKRTRITLNKLCKSLFFCVCMCVELYDSFFQVKLKLNINGLFSNFCLLVEPGNLYESLCSVSTKVSILPFVSNGLQEVKRKQISYLAGMNKLNYYVIIFLLLT